MLEIILENKYEFKKKVMLLPNFLVVYLVFLNSIFFLSLWLLFYFQTLQDN